MLSVSRNWKNVQDSPAKQANEGKPVQKGIQ